MRRSSLILSLFFILPLFAADEKPILNKLTPDQAFQKLREGNQRYINDRSTHPNRTAERRLETSQSQEPFAVILGCSDSRVAPEIIFDQGLGDLFIVRVAGNVLGPINLDSIDYSVKYLHSSLVVVLGHENCGAVKAVIAGTTKDVEAVARLIDPAVHETEGQTDNRLEDTIRLNVENVVNQLKKAPVIRKLIDEKKVMVVGGYYNFHTGEVEYLGGPYPKK